MRIRIKICGVREAASIEAAADAGADAVGFVFADSPRRIDPRMALELSRVVPAYMARVGVMRTPSERDVAQLLALWRPDRLQFEVEQRGALPEAYRHAYIPVFHDNDHVIDQVICYLGSFNGPTPLVHLEGEGRGGRGVRVDLERAAAVAEEANIVLAGGLDPDNVGEAIRAVRPHGVDVSSGVESAPGVKDPARVRAFVEAVRDAERSL